MKMQMKIRTPGSGTITKINTKTGNQVDKGVLLISIDPDDNPSQ
jgi:biotin carboxyl carrier protein